jgi:hypothetical protein
MHPSWILPGIERRFLPTAECLARIRGRRNDLVLPTIAPRRAKNGGARTGPASFLPMRALRFSIGEDRTEPVGSGNERIALSKNGDDRVAPRVAEGSSICR